MDCSIASVESINHQSDKMRLPVMCSYVRICSLVSSMYGEVCEHSNIRYVCLCLHRIRN